MMQAILSREDFEGEPVSLDEIESGLWLGNVAAAKDAITLRTAGITHILTVDSYPLPDDIRRLESITSKYVELDDVAKEDLLCHLEGCIEFIAAAMNAGHRVLVHCFFGVSRSAAVAAAFLMHKYQLDYEQAIERVKAKRPSVGPNPGFVQQLTLFHRMNWRIDEENQMLRVFRLRLASVNITKHISDPSDYAHLIRDDPLETIPPNSVQQYRCRKCRRTLATDAQHFRHPPGSTVGNPTSAYDLRSGLMPDIPAMGAGRVACSESIFIEPIAWMEDVYETQGKLHCPKCETKLGSFDWTTGIPCPCGAVVAPAFYLVPSKVELRRVMDILRN